MFEEIITTPIEQINDEEISSYGVKLSIKREDLTDPIISGNKFRKLKYNLLEARKSGLSKLVTFGGAYSNHIHAVAYAGKRFGFETVGIIRGEETLPLNPTLRDATKFGMQLHYISRSEFKEKNTTAFHAKLKEQLGEFFLIPEGGSNALAVRGCKEILPENEQCFDHICCACGTGGTMAGLIVSLNGQHNLLGFPVLKNGDFLNKDIRVLISSYINKEFQNWSLITDFHFGGYAKYNDQLIKFINRFKKKHKIQLDPIYTGKLVYGIYQLIKNGQFRRGDSILAIHTGGIQGINGFNQRFGQLIKV